MLIYPDFTSSATFLPAVLLNLPPFIKEVPAALNSVILSSVFAACIALNRPALVPSSAAFSYCFVRSAIIFRISAIEPPGMISFLLEVVEGLTDLPVSSALFLILYISLSIFICSIRVCTVSLLLSSASSASQPCFIIKSFSFLYSSSSFLFSSYFFCAPSVGLYPILFASYSALFFNFSASLFNLTYSL